MITTIIMPFREQNLSEVIAGIRSQSVKSEIWSWDDTGKFKDKGEDVYFYCSKNLSHRPRFILGSLVTTEYIFIQDDDFKLEDPDLFKKLIELSEKYPDYLIGTKGKKFDDTADPEKPYQHNTCWKSEGEVDMVNTGLSFFRTELLNKLPFNFLINPVRTITEQDYQYADDMYLSSFNKCYSTELFKGVKKLDERGKGLSHDSIHMDIRNRKCREYWLSK